MDSWATLAGNPWGWAALGVALVVLETLVSGFFLLWLGLAALLTALLVAGLGLSGAAALGVFAFLALFLVLIGRRVVRRHPVESEDAALNQRSLRLLGQKVTLTEPIRAGEGRAIYGDGSWLVTMAMPQAPGSEIPVGTVMTVVGMEGARLIVALDADPAVSTTFV